MSEEMWINHFSKMAEGKVPYSKEFCVVDENYKRPPKHNPKVQAFAPRKSQEPRSVR